MNQHLFGHMKKKAVGWIENQFLPDYIPPPASNTRGTAKTQMATMPTTLATFLAFLTLFLRTRRFFCWRVSAGWISSRMMASEGMALSRDFLRDFLRDDEEVTTVEEV